MSGVHLYCCIFILIANSLLPMIFRHNFVRVFCVYNFVIVFFVYSFLNKSSKKLLLRTSRCLNFGLKLLRPMPFVWCSSLLSSLARRLSLEKLHVEKSGEYVN